MNNIGNFNCTACGMKVELSMKRITVCKNCNKLFNTSVFNRNTKKDEPLVTYTYTYNDKK